MELATGPLPSRAPTTTPAEHAAHPWGEFLQRVLVSVSPDCENDAQAAAEAGSAGAESATAD